MASRRVSCCALVSRQLAVWASLLTLHNSAPASHCPSPQGYEAAAALLLERGASLTIQDKEQDTVLHYALLRTDEREDGPKLTRGQRAAQEAQRLRLVDLLLRVAEQRQRGGAAQLANMRGNFGCSALHVAALNNLLEVAQLLLEHGADFRCGAAGLLAAGCGVGTHTHRCFAVVGCSVVQLLET